MIKKLHLKNIIKYFYENLSILNTETKPATDLIIGAEYQDPHIGLFILSNPDKLFNTIYLKGMHKYDNSESNLSKNIDFVLGELPYENNSLDNIYFDNNVFKFIRGRGVLPKQSEQSLTNIINKLKSGGNLYIPFETYDICLEVFRNMLDINFSKVKNVLYSNYIQVLQYEHILFVIFFINPILSLIKLPENVVITDTLLTFAQNDIVINFNCNKDEILNSNIQVIEAILKKHFTTKSVETVDPFFKKRYTADKNKNVLSVLPWMNCTKN